VTEPLEPLAASFARHLRAAGKAPRTIKLYGDSVRFFSDWLAVHGREPTLDELTRSAITGWLADMAVTSQPNTVASRLRAMRRFCKWLVAEGLLEVAPTDGIEQPVPPDKPVPILTDEEITALLKACTVPQGKATTYDQVIFSGRRDEVILRLLLDTGVRVSELAGLTVTDVDLSPGLAYVMGKGSRPRAVSFGAKTAQALDRYLRLRARHPHAYSPRLLLSQRGPLSVDGVRDMLNARAAQAGLTGVHPHRFRHTFAHRWLAGGGQERDLKILAGWSSDAMLSRYAASTAVQRAQDAHRRLGLGDRL